MKPTVYIETSVISYHAAKPSRDVIVAAHQRITLEWWQNVLHQCEPHVSQAVLDEIARGDPEAAATRLDMTQGMTVLEVTGEVVELANAYAERLRMPDHARTDSIHLAVASWHGMDFLVTWNCRHIAAAHVRRAVARVNSRRGIPTPEICTPEELMEL
jgi:hypothetical protein